jgi:chromosome segregation ATPase
MDTLKQTVISVRAQLKNSKKTLRVVEKNAQRSIGYEVKEMREAILRGDQRMQHGVSEMESFLTSIEYNDTSSIDLSPQMNWLTKKLDAIIGDFKSAESSADAAREYTTNSVLEILDASEIVKRQEARLKPAKDLGHRLANQARAELSESQIEAANTRKSLADTRKAVNDSESRVAELRTEKASLESAVEEVRKAIQEADKEVRRHKQKSKAFSWVSNINAERALRTLLTV